MARYIDADALIERILKLKGTTDDMYGMGIARGIERAETAIGMQPTADVVPKSEYEKLEVALRRSLPSYYQVISEEKAIELGKEYGKREVAREILSDLKKQIHDKAIYPGAKDTYSFVNVKVFDAVLNNVLKKYTEGENE